MRLAYSAEKIVSRIVRLAGMGSIVLLGIMMMLTVVDVVLRYLFSRPIRGGMELTEYLMVCVGTLGLAWCALQLAHIKVDLVVSKFPQTAQKVIDSLNYLLVIAVSGLIASQTFMRSVVVRQLGVASAMLDVPQYPFVLVVSFSYFLLFLASIMLLIHSISKVVKK
ncbi:MAG: TRAP transporter small permease [Dehalococcoidia bacterium]|nr:TRAP transporter small permease [Dehalococcoidia bacterium]